MSRYRVAVVGATGAVGTVMRAKLQERGFPAREIVPFASERSRGRELDGVPVQVLAGDTIGGFDLALFSAGGSTSGEWAPKFVAAGAVVVDNSSRWRREPGVPLVVSEVNPEALDAHDGLIANPNCSTMQLMVALKPIHEAAGLERLFRALGDRHRVKIVSALARGRGEAVCVCDFVALLGLAQPTVSYHLKQLSDVGLLERERRGTFAYYRLAPGALERVRGLLVEQGALAAA